MTARAALVAMRFVDPRGEPTERYPYNPNGSIDGIAGLTTEDGRFTIVMPHPERVFRTVQMSWQPPGLRRGFAVDADVPQRPAARGLSRRPRRRQSRWCSSYFVGVGAGAGVGVGAAGRPALVISAITSLVMSYAASA